MTRRRLLNLLTGLSLLLCVAVVVLWVRSYWRMDHVSRYWPQSYREVVSARGDVVMRVTTYPRPVPRTPEELRLRHRSGPADSGLGVRGSGWLEPLGFRRATLRHPGGGYTLRIVTFPWWVVLLVAALPAALGGWLAYRRHVAHSRRLSGLCPRCGYDLRATPGRCPECGKTRAGP